MDQQQRLLAELQMLVRDTAEFARAQSQEQLIRLPTGDGMALVFFGDPEAPVRCALELGRTLRDHPDIKLRMGIHSGPVYRVADINANRNVSGGGINIAQRVMDCGDAGHILVSTAQADVLDQLTSRRHMLHDLGDFEVKHGLRLHLYNLYSDEAGNSERPTKANTLRQPLAFRFWQNALALGLTSFFLACTIFLLGCYWWHAHFRAALSLPLEHKEITFVGNALMPAVSPDGNSIAYVTGQQGDQKLMMQGLSGGPSIELLHAELLSFPRWSPDGSEVLLMGSLDGKREETLILSRLGGTPRQVGGPGESCWSRDGSQIITANGTDIGGTLVSIDRSTGIQKRLPSPTYQWFRDIDCSRNTDMLLLLVDSSGKHQIWTMRTDGTGQHKFVETEDQILSPRWSPRGDAILYFLKQGDTSDLLRMPISGQTIPATIISGLEVGDYFTLSHDGAEMAYTRTQNYSNLWSVDLIGSGTSAKLDRQLTLGTLSYGHPSISPDGRWVVFTMGSSDKQNIYKMAINGGQPAQLTFFDTATSTSPAWSPDGQQVAFICDQGGAAKVWIVSADGTSARQLHRTDASDTNRELAWAPSTDIIYQKPGMHNLRRLNVGSQEESVIRSEDADGWLTLSPRSSPDGKRIAVYWSRHDADGVWVINLERYSEELFGPRHYAPFGWSPDGNFVYAFMIEGGREIIQIDLRGSREFKPIITLGGEIDSAAISPDGRKIIVSVEESKSDVWLLRNFETHASQEK